MKMHYPTTLIDWYSIGSPGWMRQSGHSPSCKRVPWKPDGAVCKLCREVEAAADQEKKHE